MTESFVRAEEIHKSFGKGKGKVDVLRGVNFVLSRGDMVAVLGASGAGKSTMLHILGGLERPDSGRVFYKGQDIYGMEESSRSAFRNKEVGFVFQAHHLLPEFTALENVMMPALIRGDSRKDAEDRAYHLLGRVGLSARVTHKPGELSGGEQQRVAIARALVMSPKVLLADEPTGNLDSNTGDEVFGLMTELNSELGITYVMVTHNERLASRAGRQVVVQDGRIAA